MNANLFIALGGAEASTPTDIVFENGRLGPNAAHTILLADTVRSGARNTMVCPGRYDTYRVQSTAVAPITVRNVTRGADHPLCRST